MSQASPRWHQSRSVAVLEALSAPRSHCSAISTPTHLFPFIPPDSRLVSARFPQLPRLPPVAFPLLPTTPHSGWTVLKRAIVINVLNRCTVFLID
ncbi:hypothetical protein BDN70DRAFT_714129 [Pholiota conissans]|uniref:Uncharacterized protein n=1 Tax=Pholiota conissans TaxID=109636 RepID=A0A9P5YKM5_9AGAR|nr:hypothetical protein BDN70DRAFT_714129 [Pholiota conissans]